MVAFGIWSHFSYFYLTAGVSSPTAWGVYRRVPNRAVSGR
jgi:hypothetical protein